MDAIKNTALKDIISSITDSLISYLLQNSKDVLYVNMPPVKIPEKFERYITIDDRIPSKKFDTIIINMDKEVNAEKVAKYVNKFQKYLLLVHGNNQFFDPRSYPEVRIAISTSPIIEHVHTFTKLSEGYKEFRDSQEKLQKFIKEHHLKLGIIAPTTQNQFDHILIFHDNNLKDLFISYIENEKNEDIFHEFYSMTFSQYAKHIDSRNIRFQKNASYLIKQLQTGSNSTKRGISSIFHSLQLHLPIIIQKMRGKSNAIGSKLQKGIQTISKARTNIPKVENKEKLTNKKPHMQLKTATIQKEKVSSQLDKLKVTLYQRQHIPMVKTMSYESFLARQKKGFLEQLQERRSLQTLKLQPKVSILLVVDDIDEIWLNKSVRSIKDQTYKHWELVIVDNCSPRTYLKSYLSSLNDPRIKTHFYNTKKTYAECLSHAYKVAKGEYLAILHEGDELDINLLYHFVREINKESSLEFIYCDEDEINEQGKRVHPFIKPAWDKTLILSYPYAKNIFVAKRELLERIDGFKNLATKDPLWDIMIKTRSATNNIGHISKILYHKRHRPLQSGTPKQVYPDAIKQFMARETIQGVVKESQYPGSFYIIDKQVQNPQVSLVLIEQNPDNLAKFLENFSCSYNQFDIHAVLPVNTQFSNKENIYLHSFQDFSFSKITQQILQESNSDYLLFIDSRIRPVNSDFLSIMLSYSQNRAIVGTKILDPDDMVIHSMYVLNLREVVSSLYEGQIDQGQFDISITRECSAVSRKCMLVPKEFLLTHQLDDGYTSSYADIDLCLQAQKDQIPVIYTPDAYAKAIYAYSKEKFHEADTVYFIKKWKEKLKGNDPFIDISRFLSIKA